MSAPELLIRADYVYLAGLFRCDDEVYELVSGVHVLPMTDGGVAIIALNGHMACMMRDKEGLAARPMTLHVSDAFLRACRAYDNPNPFDKDETDYETGLRRNVMLNNGRLVVVNQDAGEVFVQPGFPLWEGDFPKLEFFGTILDELQAEGDNFPLMSSSSLATIMDAFSYLGEVHSTLDSIQVRHGGQGRGVLFRSYSCDDIMVVCMSLKCWEEQAAGQRAPAPDAAPPAWLAAVPGATGSAA